MNSPAATSSGAPSARPSASSPRSSRPLSRARPSTACTSRAKPRVPTARRQRLGPGDRLGVVGEQLAHHHVGLGRRQQPQRAVVDAGGRVGPHQAVGEGVERRAQRGRAGAAEPGGDPVAQLLGGLAGEGQRQHLVGAGAALLDAVDDRLDQGRGLAGAGTGQHQHRPARVVDDALLVGVEDRPGHLSGLAALEPVGRAREVLPGVLDGHGTTQPDDTDSGARAGVTRPRGARCRPRPPPGRSAPRSRP